MLLTPTYHAYRMYIPFQDATSLPAVVSNDQPYTSGTTSVPGVSVSAARAKDGKLYVALVNTNPRQATSVDLNVPGQAIGSVAGQVLTADAMDAHNTFDNKAAVKPVPYSAKANGGKMTVALPAKSVMVVAVEG